MAYRSEECFKWCHLRKVFGKPLVEQPVIRAKLAKMINHIEFGQAQIEAITYQSTSLLVVVAFLLLVRASS